MINNRVLIITGGSMSFSFVKDYLAGQKFDIIIAVDSGLTYAKELNLPIHYIVGDFDSVPLEVIEYYKMETAKHNATTIKEYNPEKDVTDTQIAIELALDLKADEIILLGATGTRLDHLLANIHLLYLPLLKNVRAYIIDEHNKLYLLNQNYTLYKKELFGPFISLIPFTEVVYKVSLEGFKYPLMKRDMFKMDSLGVSNEVILEKANIFLESGILTIIESKD